MVNKNLLIYILLLILFVSSVKAQDPDTLAVIQIKNTLPQTPNEWTFELHIQRSGDYWQKFVNATFELQLYDYDFEKYEKFNPEDIELSVDSSWLPLIHNQQRPLLSVKDSFYLETRIDTNIIRIWIDGPDSLFNIPNVPERSEGIETVLLAKMRLTAKNGYRLTRAPILKFSRPLSYYQDVAFKNLKLDTIDQIRYYEHDNISLYNPTSNLIVDYREDPDEPFSFKLRDINATYVGNKTINVNWSTRREIWQSGFKVKRIILPPFTTDVDNLDFENDGELVASYEPSSGDLYESSLSSTFTKSLGDDYDADDTDVLFRGSIYCYQVSYDDNTDEKENWILGEKCLKVPNAVITFAAAQPNPMQFETKLEFFVEDDVNMLAEVFDLEGRSIVKIFDNEFIQKGRHFVNLVLPEFATEGLYTVLLVATPVIDDDTNRSSDAMVKESSAMIKIQKIN